MTDDLLLRRVTSSPNVLAGKPVIRGTRLSVDFVLNALAHGTSEQGLLDEYTGLTRDDVKACLLFASRFLSDAAFMPLSEVA
jgi:uncharacterized protein (DUF433 family)